VRLAENVKQRKPHQTKSKLKLCAAGCGGMRDREGQRYCAMCHRDYQRQWRRDHPHSGTRRRA
jgi:hypothetical protein